jgi:hypothetical protein
MLDNKNEKSRLYKNPCRIFLKAEEFGIFFTSAYTVYDDRLQEKMIGNLEKKTIAAILDIISINVNTLAELQ